MPKVTSFPALFPESAAMTVADYARGKNTDRWAAAEAAYDLLGFALNVARGSPRVVTGPMLTDEQAADELSAMVKRFRNQGTVVQNSPTPVQSSPSEEGESTNESGESVRVSVPAQVIQSQNMVPSWMLPFLVALLQRLVTT